MNPSFDDLVIYAENQVWSSLVGRRQVEVAPGDAMIVRERQDSIFVAIVDAVPSLHGFAAIQAHLLGHLPPPDWTADAISDAFISADIGMVAKGIEGEASALAFVLTGRSIAGSSTGDCSAWFLPDEAAADPIHLTAHQNHRPRIGDCAAPVSFRVTLPGPGILIAAADGFWVNVSLPDLFGRIKGMSKDILGAYLANGLANHVFERSGDQFPDDLSLFAATIL